MGHTLLRLLIMLPILLFSLVVHEVAHGYAAYIMGDPTAKRLGRLTLDPLAHLDPLGTLMMIWTFISGYGVGWAKPVPINFRNFRNRRLGTIVVGISGPLANILLALACSVPLRSALASYAKGENPYLAGILSGAIVVNVALASFNLLPIPPLDGSRVVYGLLRGKLAYFYAQLEKYGMFVLLMLALLGWLSYLVFPLMNFIGPLVVRWTGVSFGWVLRIYGTLL